MKAFFAALVFLVTLSAPIYAFDTQPRVMAAAAKCEVSMQEVIELNKKSGFVVVKLTPKQSKTVIDAYSSDNDAKIDANQAYVGTRGEGEDKYTVIVFAKNDCYLGHARISGAYLEKLLGRAV